MKIVGKVLVWMLVGVVVTLILFSVRPLFHGLAVKGLLMNFWFWMFLLIACVLIAALTRWRRVVRGYPLEERHPTANLLMFLTVLAMAVGVLVFAVLGRAWTYTRLNPAISFQEIAALPETTAVRYLPYEVARTYAVAKQENPTRRVGDIDALQVGGDLLWVAPRVPQGWVNFFADPMDGVFFIRSDGSIDLVETEFKYGEGMGITDSLHWQFAKRKFWATYPEIFYIPSGDEVLGIAPYITYSLRFPVTVPRWGGVFVVHPDGEIEDLSPAEAVADPRLADMRLFPEKMARLYSEAYAYRLGIGNAFFRHRNQPVIPLLQATENQMPYLVPTEGGQKWVVLTEPYGPSQAVFKVFLYDAHSGAAQVVDLAEKRLIGPNKAWDFAKAALKGYVWFESHGSGQSGTYLLIEPRPLVHGGRLLWLYNVTTTDYAGGGAFVIVDAASNQVTTFETRDALDLWLKVGIAPQESPVAPRPEPLLQELERLLREALGILGQLQHES